MVPKHDTCSERRRFMQNLALAGAATAIGFASPRTAAQSKLDTTRIRFPQHPGTCTAPFYVAEELLRAEGLNVQFVKIPGASHIYTSMAAGETDLGVAFIAPFAIQVDQGKPIVMLAGIHPGCYEVFATNGVRSIRDLRGKRVSIPEPNGTHHVFIATIMSHIGLDPKKDVAWVIQSPEESMRHLAEGKVDALVAFPPNAQELRAKKIGQVIMNSGVDKPWSQYFCCVVAGRRGFVEKYPVATKHAVRAILKANSICSTQPEQTARFLVDRGFTPTYEYALQAMREIPYARWRDFSTEDSVRYFALRLQELGFIKSSPKALLAKGTDWRFLDELKKELKA